jgi:hypothetical protein
MLPTFAATIVVGVGPDDWKVAAVRVAVAYAALILSFLGGAWWGLASAHAEAGRLQPWLVVSVIPALVAWPLVFTPSPLSLWILAMLFAATLVVDRQMMRASIAPVWWWSLRWPLSMGMAVLHACLGWMSRV